MYYNLCIKKMKQHIHPFLDYIYGILLIRPHRHTWATEKGEVFFAKRQKHCIHSLKQFYVFPASLKKYLICLIRQMALFIILVFALKKINLHSKIFIF